MPLYKYFCFGKCSYFYNYPLAIAALSFFFLDFWSLCLLLLVSGIFCPTLYLTFMSPLECHFLRKVSPDLQLEETLDLFIQWERHTLIFDLSYFLCSIYCYMRLWSLTSCLLSIFPTRIEAPGCNPLQLSGSLLNRSN